MESTELLKRLTLIKEGARVTDSPELKEDIERLIIELNDSGLTMSPPVTIARTGKKRPMYRPLSTDEKTRLDRVLLKVYRKGIAINAKFSVYVEAPQDAVNGVAVSHNVEQNTILLSEAALKSEDKDLAKLLLIEGLKISAKDPLVHLATLITEKI